MEPYKQLSSLTHDLFRQVVEAAPNAMVMADPDGVIVLVNAQAEKLFGYPRSELVGNSVDMLVPERLRSAHPEHRRMFYGDLRSRPMGTGRDLFALRKDGTEVPVEIGLNPVTTAGGIFVLAAIVDITERRRLEERFRQVVEAAPNAMVMVDRRGRIVLVNAQTEKLFGYDREQLFGKSIETLVPERFRAAHQGFRTAYLEDLKPRLMGTGRDLYGRRQDRSEFPVEIGLNPVRTSDESFVLAAIVDITERKRAEMALKESEERFHLAVRGASAGLWDWNLQTGVVYLSPHFKEILGYEPNELPNDSQAVTDATHPDDIERVKTALTAHLEQKRPYDIEYRILTKSGEYRWINARGQALWNPSGEAYRMVGWIIDVTERRLADKALRESREELKRLSANIQRAREEEKTRIARELHDDLGQQLAALKIECARNDNRVEGVDSLEPGGNISNIYALIDQLVVSVRRIATDLRPAMLDDLGLLPAIEWFVERFSSRHGILVVQHIDAEDIGFNYDSATAVFRIVQEALTNVARHSGATKVTLEIARREENCIVRIVDNGRGCPSDARPAPNSFGLVGIRERVSALRGKLKVQTAPDQGFAITISLPLASVEARDQEKSRGISG
jgi:two-component system sensor histidine kinase UhpB